MSSANVESISSQIYLYFSFSLNRKSERCESTIVNTQKRKGLIGKYEKKKKKKRKYTFSRIQFFREHFHHFFRNDGSFFSSFQFHFQVLQLCFKFLYPLISLRKYHVNKTIYRRTINKISFYLFLGYFQRFQYVTNNE